ncbi:MAG: hypothetical protein QNJ90_02030 [Planctomycetota bacterium]|nr:hypothetical protein [Planctomycetota bacterium]
MTDQEQQLMKRLEDLCQWIREGKIIEAMYEFYDDSVEMQENLEEPCVGLEANIEREKNWLAMVKEFKGYEVKSLGVGGNTTFQECTFHYVTTEGKEVFTAQIARAIWKDNKIVNERFYWHP